MQDNAKSELPAPKRIPWNKGKLTGAKPLTLPRRSLQARSHPIRRTVRPSAARAAQE